MIEILCYNADGELLTGYTHNTDLKKDDYVEVDGKGYKITNAEKGVRSMLFGETVIINFQEYKAKKFLDKQ